MMPAMSGRAASLPDISSKQRKTASLWNVPPCTTIRLPSCFGSVTFITFSNAFFMTEYASPAEISATGAPSFCACFTREFIKTVHLVPKSTGFFAYMAMSAKSGVAKPSDFANVSMNEPQPAEHASLSRTESITPSFILMHFMS
jgi:hypothetical protein